MYVNHNSLDPAQEPEVRHTNAYLKRACEERMNDDACLFFHQQNAQNQRKYRHNQGINELDANYEQYLLQVENNKRIPLEDHSYVKKQQEKLRSDISK